MPIYRQRRFTRTCLPGGSRASCAICTRLARNDGARPVCLTCDTQGGQFPPRRPRAAVLAIEERRREAPARPRRSPPFRSQKPKIIPSMRSYLDFEKPVAELEAKIEELRAMQAGGTVAVGDEIARPEGYRKAVRLMEMADRFAIPVLALVDTAGAYPGIGAEERGQAEAIAQSTAACLDLGVPNVALILGEGGSGGAVAIATANRVLMLEHAIYSVISPEGAASILWRDTTKAQDAATNMKITAADLTAFGIIDGIVTEPIGGAHRDPAAAIASTGEAIANALGELKGLDRETVRQQRRDKFLAIGRNLE